MNAPTRSIAQWIAAPTFDPLDALETASARLNSVQALIRQTAIDDDLGDPGRSSGGLWSSVSLLETIATLLEGASGTLERRA